MSDPDQADEGKGFLARWSQRKQEARQPDGEPKPEGAAVEAGAPSGPKAKAEAAEEFDLSSLPKLEDLTGTTDITAFLRKGVPEHLRNEALRKSWALDPAIRNYVNPAMEYAYDWNTPGGVPGSGELGAGIDIARMVSQIMGSGPAEAPAAAAEPSESGPAQTTGHDAPQKSEQELPTQALRLDDETASVAPDRPNAASGGMGSNDTPNAEPSGDAVAPQNTVRRHGSAKPTL
jgi:hypothetical protein